MTIPTTHPKTMHLEPYHLNDSFPGMRQGIRKGYRYYDQDSNCDAEGTFWIKHWGTPRKDGFKYLTTAIPGRRVKDPHPNLPIYRRTSANMRRLRRQRVGGTRYRTAAEHANYLGAHGKIMCIEAKGSPGFKKVENWKRFKSELKPGVTVYVMTLQNIAGWKERLKAAHAAGFEVALLPRGHRPPDWAEFAPYVQVWGHFKK